MQTAAIDGKAKSLKGEGRKLCQQRARIIRTKGGGSVTQEPESPERIWNHGGLKQWELEPWRCSHYWRRCLMKRKREDILGLPPFLSPQLPTGDSIGPT